MQIKIETQQSTTIKYSKFQENAYPKNEYKIMDKVMTQDPCPPSDTSDSSIQDFVMGGCIECLKPGIASLCDKCEKVYVCAKRKKKNKKKPICKNCKKNVLNKTKILQEGGKYPPPVISDGVGSKVKKQPEVIDIDGDDREDIKSPLQTRGQRRSKAEELKSSNSSKSSEKSRAVIK